MNEDNSGGNFVDVLSPWTTRADKGLLNVALQKGELGHPEFECFPLCWADQRKDREKLDRSTKTNRKNEPQK